MPTTTSALGLQKPTGTDPVSVLRTSIGANADALDGAAIVTNGNLSSRPAAGTANRYYYATDKARLYRDTGTAWETIGGRQNSAHALGTSGDFNQVNGVQTYPGVALPQCSVSLVCTGAPVEVNASARVRQGNSSGGFAVFLAVTYDGGLPPGVISEEQVEVSASLGFNGEAELSISGLVFTPSAGTHTIALTAFNPSGVNWWAVGNHRRLSVRELLA